MNEHGQPDLFGEPQQRVFGGRGYAAQPGTGPQGETCRTCRHKVTAHSQSGQQSWVKCGLVRQTHGAGTDIRAAAPACLRWERRS